MSNDRHFRPPKHARRAWWAFWIIGAIECVVGGIVVLGARDAVSNRWPIGVATITVGCALIGIGHALGSTKALVGR